MQKLDEGYFPEFRFLSVRQKEKYKEIRSDKVKAKKSIVVKRHVFMMLWSVQKMLPATLFPSLFIGYGKFIQILRSSVIIIHPLP